MSNATKKPPRAPKGGSKAAVSDASRRSRPFGISLLIAFSAILLASILLPSQTSTLNNGLGTPGKALILTAHPDDEVMFFTPSILGLQRAGWDVSGLCLSTGNSDGLGGTRRHELTAAYEVLGVKREKVMVIDHPLLQDDIHTRWSPGIVGAVVDSYLSEHDIDIIITFDRQGISNHPNHASLSSYRSNTTMVYHLDSPSLAIKYAGPLLRLIPSSVVSHLKVLSRSLPLPWSAASRQTITIGADLNAWRIGVQAMMQHRTQMVWFRWLYLATSRLMWVNELVRVV